jgi:predicted aspartyl protease
MLRRRKDAQGRRTLWGALCALRIATQAGMATVAVAGFWRGASAEPSTPEACQHLVARVPLRNDAGFINAPASLNGHAARMIVDTGSEGSLVSPEAMALFDMRADPERRTVVQGTGGEGRLVPNAIIHSLRIGGLEFGPVSVPVEALPAIPALVPAIEGLVGADLLSRYDVEFSVAEGWMAFWSPATAACSGPAGWRYLYRAVPLDMTPRKRLMASVELDGHTLHALLDSGARSTIVSNDAAHRAGVAAATLAGDPGGLAAGLDGRGQVYHWHRFQKLRVGQEEEIAPVLTVSPVHDAADMLLGADWFMTHRVWISYATRSLYLMPARKRTEP